MTLVLALICTDGIIMASDGQSTFPTGAGPMRLPSEKIHAVGSRLLWGGSGDVGLLQKIGVVLCDLSEYDLSRAITKLRPAMRGKVRGEQEAAAKSYLPVEKAFPQPVAHVLFSGYDGERLGYWRWIPTGQTPNLRSMGSQQSEAGRTSCMPC